MIVVPSEVFYQPKFTYIWTLGVGRFPDALRRRVEPRDRAARNRPLLSGRRGPDVPGELARVTGLSRPEAGLGNRALVREGYANMLSPGTYQLCEMPANSGDLTWRNELDDPPLRRAHTLPYCVSGS